MEDKPPSSNLISLLKSFFSDESKQKEDLILENQELEFVKNIEHFFSTTVNEVMVPRTKIVSIESNATIKDAIKLVNETGHSRIPVKNKKIDNIVGVLYAKDLLNSTLDDPKIPISKIMREHYSVPFSQPIHELLRHFKSLRVHLGIVIDEYGGVDGLITIEDVIEQLIGKIHDEFDEQANEPKYTIDDDVVIIDANYPLIDFNKLFQKEFEKEGVETIGGYICDFMGKMPEAGDQCELEEGFPIQIEERNEKVLTKLKILSKITSTTEV